MNVVLSMIVITEACFGICVWFTPERLRRLAAHLLTRADVIEAARAEQRRRIQFWCGELGVTREALTAETTIAAPAVSTLVRN